MYRMRFAFLGLSLCVAILTISGCHDESSDSTHVINQLSSPIDNHINPKGDAESPQVAVDNSGNAIVVWEQNNGDDDEIFMSEYRNGSWTHPTGLTDNISPDGQATSWTQVAMDDNGNAIVVWLQSDGTHDQIFKSEYRSGSWTHPTGLTNNISPFRCTNPASVILVLHSTSVSRFVSPFRCANPASVILV